jgi:uncharacterized protein (DUF2225 family)
MRIAKHIGIWISCLFILFAAVPPGSTHTEPESDIECPVCHTAFKAVIDLSSSRHGMRLDLKPVGPIPAPWVIPKCPKCGFIVYKQEWEEAEQLKVQQLVNSEEYKKILPDNSTYFILARIYEYVGMDDFEIAHTYLKASWQVEHDKAKCAKYLEESLKKFEAFLAASKDKTNERIMSELVSGEIERRLGRFDQAQSRFNRIKSLPEFNEAENITGIITYQLQLIAAKDTAPHEIDR